MKPWKIERGNFGKHLYFETLTIKTDKDEFICSVASKDKAKMIIDMQRAILLMEKIVTRALKK